MLARGLPASLVAVLMREVSDMKAILSIPGAGDTYPFEFQRGGKQGGVETPDEWNWLIEETLEPVVDKWTRLGWGVCFETGELVHHAVWADNIIILAASFQ
eukprot:3676558-Karenia_brevis.AAC.1